MVGSMQDVLLVQCRPRDITQVAEMVAEDPGCGIVLTDRSISAARQRLRHLQQQVPADRMLLDAAAYAGSERKRARERFTSEWIKLQRELGLWVLPDAGYIDEGDSEGLRSILERTKQLGDDAIAPLALHRSWLDERAGLPQLIEAVGEAGVPAALMLEHRHDPFSSSRTLRGVLRLIALAPAPVLVLRCDLSSIGLLCHGAHAAAVGTTTGLRHLYPVTTGGGGFRPPKVAALIRECLSYVSLEKIFAAVQAEPDNQMWVCGCRSCAGETIDQLQMRPDREAAAFTHSVDVLRQLRNELIVDGPSSARPSSWAAKCDNALFRAEQMADIDRTWPSPDMLARWTAVHPATRHP